MVNSLSSFISSSSRPTSSLFCLRRYILEGASCTYIMSGSSVSSSGRPIVGLFKTCAGSGWFVDADVNCNFANSSAISSGVGCIVRLVVNAVPAVSAGNTGGGAGGGAVGNPAIGSFGPKVCNVNCPVGVVANCACVGCESFPRKNADLLKKFRSKTVSPSVPVHGCRIPSELADTTCASQRR